MTFVCPGAGVGVGDSALAGVSEFAYYDVWKRRVQHACFDNGWQRPCGPRAGG